MQHRRGLRGSVVIVEDISVAYLSRLSRRVDSGHVVGLQKN